jgi:diguanylate cyclase (GGDEF)-like protein
MPRPIEGDPIRRTSQMPFDPRLDTMAVRIFHRNVREAGIYVPIHLAENQMFWGLATGQYRRSLVRNRRLVQIHLPNMDKNVKKNFIKESALQTSVDIAEDLEDLYNQSVTDEKTGAWGPRAAVNYIDRLIFQRRRGETSGVLVIDADHFKMINDSEGHLAGDKVLRRLVTVMEEQTRSVDMVARFGGEEFIIVLSTLPNQAVAERRAEKVRAAIEADGDLPLTVSIGVTTIQDQDTSETVLNRADVAMYHAKSLGRNKVVNVDPNGTIRDITNNVTYPQKQ